MTARFHCALRLAPRCTISLPPGAARHVQVRRLQPGDALILFDGFGGEYAAMVESMGRSDVSVRVEEHLAVEREARQAVHLAVGMPANERMDWLVEKATELGVASIQPLVTAHGVLRLANERADKKRTHWEAIAIAACEQCGRNQVPVIHPVQAYGSWLGSPASSQGDRKLLSLAAGARPLQGATADDAGSGTLVLSGPEGGLSTIEEQQAVAQGFQPSMLGPRVLRAETAALAALVLLADSDAARETGAA